MIFFLIFFMKVLNVFAQDIYKPGYLVSNHQLCDSPINQTNLTDRSLVVLVILVISAPGHTAERQGIRKGWGRHKHREDVVFAFLIGKILDNQTIQIILIKILYTTSAILFNKLDINFKYCC